MVGTTQYMLDTNICIYIIKQQPPKVFRKFQALNIGQVSISAITYSEMQYGISNSSQPDRNQTALNAFLAPIHILDYPSDASPVYGKIRTDLKRKGQIIGANDLLIATHALSLGVTLVTNNVKEFKRIKKLHIENWI